MFRLFIFITIFFIGFNNAEAFLENIKTLRQGENSSYVKILQIALNANPLTQIASFGPGSPGNETNYFGSLTKNAVIRFQKANGLTPDGVVGPKTISKLKNITPSEKSFTSLESLYFNQYTSSSNTQNTNTSNTLATANLRISHVSPENVLRGETLDIYGSGFSKNMAVYVGMDERVSFEYVDSGHVKIKIPSNYDLTVPMINVRSPLGDTRWTNDVFVLVSKEKVKSGSELNDIYQDVKKINSKNKIAFEKNDGIATKKLSFKETIFEIINPVKKAYAMTNNFFGGSISSTTYCTCYYNFGIILEIDDKVSKSTYTTAYKPGTSSLKSNYNVFSSGPNVIGGTIQSQFQCENTSGYTCTSSGDSADTTIDSMRGVGTSFTGGMAI